MEAVLGGDDDRTGWALVAAGQLERCLVGLGAGVGEEHPAVVAEQPEQPFGQDDLGLVQEQVGGVRDRTHLAGHRLGERGVGVAERADRDAGDEVGVGVAVGVPDPAALAAHQRDRRDAVVRHERGLEPPLKFLRATHELAPSGTTMVPMPESVKISSSTACGCLPSSTCAWGTPPRTARRHASILGIMPLPRPGSSRSRLVAVSRLITSPGCPGWSPSPGQSAYRPATSVRTTSLAAPRATASAAAAVSALTLYTSPRSVPRATLDTTGIRPSAISARTAAGSTVSISPTSPMSTGVPSTTACRLRAVNMFASSPDMPTANGPCRLIRPTTSLFTWPVSTMRTTSMVSGVVTRSPAVNVLGTPSRSRWAEICGPPPCTTTGLSPAYRRNTTSWANPARSASSVIAWPPYLITTVLPWKRSSHGSASIRTAALEVPSQGGTASPGGHPRTPDGLEPPLALALLARVRDSPAGGGLTVAVMSS